MTQSRLLFFLAFILGFQLQAGAQTFTIKGSVSDTLNRNSLENAAVTLIHLPDSVLSTFARTDSAGRFELHPDTAGRYVVMITFPGFADYVEGFTVKDREPLIMGAIPMVTRTHLLSEFVLRQRLGAIKIKGDTTEYAADSFHVQSGATVEDLLKKMPGLQVDKNGSVIAQGEKVEKILVDGEEFFSDDPAVVTKNLEAKAVDKVQVYDKKSDQAEFTGIDDGVKTKTINLQLKDSRKKGYFGKVSTGGGTDGFYENQGMINLFRGKRQLSAFAIVANTGKVGLGWEDREKYGSGNDSHYDEESGSMYTYFNNDDDDGAGWQGTYSGEGLPSVWTGGLHYADKWNEDKQHLAGNYRYARQNIETIGNTLTQAILPDSQFYRDERRQTFNGGERHRADGLYEWKIDTTSNFKATVSAGHSNTINRSDYQTDTRAGDGSLINESTRQLNTDGDRQSLSSNFSYRKKMAKKGRNMSVTLNETYRSSGSTSYLRSRNNYYQDQQLLSFDTTDQRKNNQSTALGIDGSLSYTEPLSKVAFLTVSYGLAINNSSSERLSFNRLNEAWNTDADTLFSSKYDFNVATHNAGATLRFVYKKYTFSLGSQVFLTRFNQKDLFRDTTLSRNYRNFSPSARFNYNFSRQKRISISYSGRTNQPTIEQIQPLRQNTDPLNISIGNPSLKQEFNNNVNFNYNSYKVLSGQYIYTGGGFNFVKDAISRSESIDSLLRRTYQYINVNGNYNGYAYGGMGIKLKQLDMQVNLDGRINISHSTSIINGVRNLSDNNVYGLSLSLSKDWMKNDKNIASFNISPGINYNDNQASVSAFATSYWSYELTAEGHAELPWKLKVSTSLWVNLRPQTAFFDRNNNVVRWDAYISRKLLKKDQLELRASLYDILNQNKGYSRVGEDNYITENTYNTIRRYGMLSLVWNFTKSPGAPAAANHD